MNQYDEMSEDLTSMMMLLDGQPNQDELKSLMKALERAHDEACKASQVLRDRSKHKSETRLKLVRKINPQTFSIAVLGMTALNLVTRAPFDAAMSL